MTEQVQVYRSDRFGELRVVSNENGEPWFVAKDVCNALGIQTRDLRKVLDEDEVSTTNVDTIHIGRNGGKAPLIVSEAGLYSLILRSRKPEAKAFKRWVTHEVIPEIRKSGGYIAASGSESDESIMARALLIAQRTIERTNARNAELEAENAEMRPKALFADAVASSDGTCLVGEVAKMLRQTGVQVGQNRLFEILRNDGLLGKTGSNKNVPTQYAMERGWFRIKETTVVHADGHTTLSRTPKVTGKGQQYLIERYGKVVS